jgi:urease subunit beta
VKKNGSSQKNKKKLSKSKKRPAVEVARVMIPGEYVLSSEPVICNQNRRTAKITVRNTGDRPCQVGSHTHFFEVNRALDFPREKAFGYRLNIPAGTSVRFEPGDSKEVELCELVGKRVCYGFNGLTMGSMNTRTVKNAAIEKARRIGFKGA